MYSDLHDAISILELPRKVIFGSGTLRRAGVVARQLGRRAVVCTDPNLAAGPVVEDLLAALAAAGVEAHVFDQGEPDLPLATAEAAAAFARSREPDLVVGVGGGSSLDLAKTTALLAVHRIELRECYGENAVPGPIAPLLAIPTTAGTGSEVTPVAVVSDPSRRMKVGISSPHLVPAAAICDPEATLGCPAVVTAHAGVDALVHAVEALVGRRGTPSVGASDDPVFIGGNPVSDLFALNALRQIGRSLEAAVADGSALRAREHMLYGSLTAGIAFGRAGTAAAHALQYPVGALTETSHGLGVGLLAPYVLEYVRPFAVPQLAACLAALTGEADPDEESASMRAVDEIDRLTRAVGIPASLEAIGIARDQLPGIADDSLGIERLIRSSPRPLDREGLLEILEAAWRGDRPSLRSGAGARMRKGGTMV